jgi:peptidyl-dipeptidase Dcp
MRATYDGGADAAEMLERLLAAQTYDQGFATVEYRGQRMVDLAFHDRRAPRPTRWQKQAEVLAGLGMPRAIRMRHATPHFAHVFAGDGYSSGYYSYMWSEVMDADAFAAFEEAGDPFDPDVAARLERFILSAGGSARMPRPLSEVPGQDAGGRGLAEGPGACWTRPERAS